MIVNVIQQQLRQLRLSTAAAELPAILEKEKKPPALEWFSKVLATEIDTRQERALGRRVKSAQFPEQVTLEEFDWSFNPGIDRKAIEELATLSFVNRRGIALFLGKPGTGKTHLALGIGHTAVRQGHRVYCTSVKRLTKDILTHKAGHSLDTLFRRMLSAKLWILDDWGVVSLNRDASEEVFDLLDRRKHSTAMILTSNRAVEEWGEVFPDPVLAGATIDRMFDRATVVEFTGQSYRLKGRITEDAVDREHS
jgi:DNA replication protein DnaC